LASNQPHFVLHHSEVSDLKARFIDPAQRRFRGQLAHHGFTLIELLVVVAIIAILAAILLPSLSAAKARAYKVQCLSNTRQLSVAWHLYSDDSNGRLPANGYGAHRDPVAGRLWVAGDEHIHPEAFTNLSYLLDPKFALFGDYIKSAGVYKCPADRTRVSVAGVEMPRIRTLSLNAYFNWEYPPYDNKNSPDYWTFRKSSNTRDAIPVSFTHSLMSPR
jgi:prepilin-type N-terminal cleavage/methylation domain-containing protein